MRFRGWHLAPALGSALTQRRATPRPPPRSYDTFYCTPASAALVTKAAPWRCSLKPKHAGVAVLPRNRLVSTASLCDTRHHMRGRPGPTVVPNPTSRKHVTHSAPPWSTPPSADTIRKNVDSADPLDSSHPRHIRHIRQICPFPFPWLWSPRANTHTHLHAVTVRMLF